MTSQTFTTTSLWTCPANVFTVTMAQLWGAGGGGSSGSLEAGGGGAGGGGGGYTIGTNIPVIPGSQYTVTVGTGGAGGTEGHDGTGVGGDGGESQFQGNGTTLYIAYGGQGATFGDVASGGTGTYYGGYGGTGSSNGGGGGGAAAGTSSTGAHGNAGSGGSGGSGGTGAGGGGSGGSGGSSGSAGHTGLTPGGGGGAGFGNSVEFYDGAAGEAGQVILTYTAADVITGAGSSALELTTTGHGGAQGFTYGASTLSLTSACTPIVQQKLIISVASEPGVRPSGAEYPAGMGLFGVGGIFGYAGVLEASGLSLSLAMNAGSDQAGNEYPAGLMVIGVYLSPVSETPLTPAANCVLYYKGGTLYALGPSGVPVALGTT